MNTGRENGFVEWDGVDMGAPTRIGETVTVLLRNGTEITDVTEKFRWFHAQGHQGYLTDIVAYRVLQ